MTPDERRAALVDVTVPLLREHGAALTTKQVAEAAGVAEGTVFRAFGTKEDLVRACGEAVFDHADVLTGLAAVDRSLSLDDRLAAGVEVLQTHLERVIGVLGALHASGVGPPYGTERAGHRRPRVTDPEVDAAFLDLVGADVEVLRLPGEDVVNILAHLTLSSAHPMFPVRTMTPAEIVSVVLDGVRKDH